MLTCNVQSARVHDIFARLWAGDLTSYLPTEYSLTTSYAQRTHSLSCIQLQPYRSPTREMLRVFKAVTKQIFRSAAIFLAPRLIVLVARKPPDMSTSNYMAYLGYLFPTNCKQGDCI